MLLLVALGELGMTLWKSWGNRWTKAAIARLAMLASATRRGDVAAPTQAGRSGYFRGAAPTGVTEPQVSIAVP